MKTTSSLLLFILFALLPVEVWAQVPQAIPYQAVARDNQTLLTNQSIEVRFSVLEGGTLSYQEVHSVQTNEYGLFTAIIGKGQQIGSRNFEDIDWRSQAHFLKVELNNDSSFVNMGTTPLRSVPYSLYSEEAEFLIGGMDNISDVLAPAPNEGDVLKWDGNQWVAKPGGSGLGATIAGAGIRISNDTIYNTGDLNAANDIEIGTGAGGDLDGLYPNPLVTGFRNNPLSSIQPTEGEILKYKNNEWVPSPDNVTSGGGVNVTARLIGDGAPGSELDIAPQGAAIGQVLKWNGSEWKPKDDSINIQRLSIVGNSLRLSNGGGAVSLPGNYIPGQGISILGSVISNTGDVTPLDDITINSQAGGDVLGTFNGLSVVRLRGNLISPTPTPQDGNILVFRGGSWFPELNDPRDDDSDPSNEIQTLTKSGYEVNLSGGGGNFILQSYQSGSGIGFLPTNDPTITEIINTGDVDATDDITEGRLAEGDLAGMYPNPIVEKIQGNKVSDTNPLFDEVLKWKGSAWEPALDNFEDADSNPSNEIQELRITGTRLSLTNQGNSIDLPYSAGTGLDLIGTQFINTGDLNGFDDVKITDFFGGDVSGTYDNLSVTHLRGFELSPAPPIRDGLVLKWDGANSMWTPATDDTVQISAGTGLSFSNNTLNLDNTSVTAGTYGSALTIPALTVDAQGRVTGVSEIPFSDNNTTYAAGSGLALTGTTFNLENTSVTAGSYGTTTEIPVLTVDSKGRVLVASTVTVTDNNTTYTAGSGLSLSSNVFSLGPTGVTAGNYGSTTEVPVLTIDSQGRVSQASSISITDNNTTYDAGAGLALSGTTFSLDNTSVSAGTYGAPNEVPVMTVDAQGRISLATTVPIIDNNTTYSAGAGLSLSNNTFSLGTTGVTPGTYGSATEIPILTVDAQGRTNFVSSIALQSANMAFNSTILPDTDDTYDLGSSTQRFNTVFSTVGVMNTSDVREKKQIEELRYGMEELMQLTPVSFTWKNQVSDDRKLGLIAQQVLPIIPNVVKTHEMLRNKKTGKYEHKELKRYGVFYADLIPVLIKGIQEQQEQIEGQEDLLEKQEEEISQQRETLEAQQKLILDMQKRLARLEEVLEIEK